MGEKALDRKAGDCFLCLRPVRRGGRNHVVKPAFLYDPRRGRYVPFMENGERVLRDVHRTCHGRVFAKKRAKLQKGVRHAHLA